MYKINERINKERHHIYVTASRKIISEKNTQSTPKNKPSSTKTHILIYTKMILITILVMQEYIRV